MTTCIKINLRFLFLTVYSFGQNTESSAIKVRSFGYVWLKVKVLVTQLCPTLCDPVHCSPPGSSVHGILQARTLEWVAISFSQLIIPKDQTQFCEPPGKPECMTPRFHPWVQKIPWRRKCLPTLVFLPGESQDQRSLAGYSPWGCEESDMTEHLTLS